MLSINMEDVAKVLATCAPYLIAFGVVLVLGIIAMVACGKLPAAKKFLVRSQSVLAILLALVIVVNLICFGPMSSMISLATGSGSISQQTADAATALCTEIADEGVVLLENEAGLLPLQNGAPLNVFGWASTQPCYGGTGSGALSDAYPVVTLLEGLKTAGFQLNTALSDFYTAYRPDRPVVGMWAQDWTMPEPPASTYSEQLLTGAKSFSDTALVVITRVGGEGADLPVDMSKVNFTDNTPDYKEFEPGEHYLQLSRSERDMLDLVCQNFDKVVVVYNGAAAMELGFVEDYSQIKGVLWCPGTGQSGFVGLGRILSGAVNPSGKTVDTFVYDLTDTPNWNNFGDFTYDNMDEFSYTSTGFTGEVATTVPGFVNYSDGIYVGYKFYETAAKEGLIDYDSKVLYPFGYGLSYTGFQQEMGPLQSDGTTLSFDVTVTNTGSVPGKDVVEVYYDPPYTSGGIEKASANLAAFAKTGLLAPGASETVKLSFPLEEMASYDERGAGAYVLEAGDYGISIRSDAHTVLAEQTLSVDATVTYGEGNKRASDAVTATNLFQYADGGITYLSRADGFANYAAATARPASLTMPAELKAQFINNSNYDPAAYNDPNDVMPVTGAKNGMTLAQLRGASYDDPQWEPLLDQLTIPEMDLMIAIGGYQTSAAPSVGKVGTVDCDGPASINNNFTGVGSIGFPSAVMIAATWSQEIADKFGESIGKMADEMEVSGWYAPAMNIHRSAFAGRNFEYYSEDGLLSGKIAAAAVRGAEKHGVYAYLKHFALNDQETKRNEFLCTWTNEQSMRELYLKGFELAVKEGGAKAVMSSFNYIGARWAGGSEELCNQLLRDEWGFRGIVLSDYFGVYGYMSADQGIRGGTDCMLVPYDTETNHVKDTQSATGVLAMRTASKNIMYTVVNSRAYAAENAQGGMDAWQIAAIVIDVVLAAAFVTIELTVVKKGLEKRRTAAI